MLATISIITYNRFDMTSKCLEHLSQTELPADVEFIISDNGSTDGTVAVLENTDLPNVRLIRYGYNTGFPYPHNRALETAAGNYFIILNNDIFIYSKDWLSLLIGRLQGDHKVALVGLEGNPSVLLDNGNGCWGDNVDYVEASCIAGRTSLLKKHGLFSQAFKMFRFEDSDLSLRYRQMGYKVELVPIKYHHERSSTYCTINTDFRDRICEHNRSIFLSRWKNYLATRRFSNRILVKAFSDGIGDILYSTPVVKALRSDHPTAEICVSTNWPDVFENNPFIHALYSSREVIGDYDRVIDFAIPYASLEPLSRSFERLAATKVQSYAPDLYLTDEEQVWARELLKRFREKFDLIVICSFQTHRITWEGRNWDIGHARDLVNRLHGLSEPRVGVVEVGKQFASTGQADLDLVDKTSIRQLIALIAQADIFIGIDSFPSHIAQAFGLRSYILFGATEPISRVIDFSKTAPIRCKHLPCIGCYHKKGSGDYNKCLNGAEACMKELTADMVFEEFVRGTADVTNTNTISYLEEKIHSSIVEAVQASQPISNAVKVSPKDPREELFRDMKSVGKRFLQSQFTIGDAAFLFRKLAVGFISFLHTRLRRACNILQERS